MKLLLQIDRNDTAPLQDQLYEQLRQMIIAGTLKPNSRVIATRFLAEQVGVSRTTILLAYERLISEGYLETRPAVGTFVSAVPPENPKTLAPRIPEPGIVRQATLHPSQIRMPKIAKRDMQEGDVDFRPHVDERAVVDSSKNLLREMRSTMDHWPASLTQAEATNGILSLRRNLAEYLAVTRGIQATPEQIFIVSGANEARTLVAHLFQRHGDSVLLESPGNKDAELLFRTRGAKIFHAPVDEDGLMTDCLPTGPVCYACVTPARQNPTGGVMPRSRRTAMIDWARNAGAYIFENDEGLEPHYQGALLPPIATIDTYGLTFHSGLLAHILGPFLHVGYLVVPTEFVEQISTLKGTASSVFAFMEQATVADMLASGVYDKLLRRLRKGYLERRDTLICALKSAFGDVRLIGTESGTQLTWVLPGQFPSAQTVCEVAQMNGVHIDSVLCDALPPGLRSPLHDRAVIFSYASLSQGQLKDGIVRLADALSL